MYLRFDQAFLWGILTIEENGNDRVDILHQTDGMCNSGRQRHSVQE